MIPNPISNNVFYLRESTIVPDITLVRETVTDESKLTLLGILNNRVHGDFLTDLLELFSYRKRRVKIQVLPRAWRWTNEEFQQPCSK
jgi:hypothetical protein